MSFRATRASLPQHIFFAVSINVLAVKKYWRQAVKLKLIARSSPKKFLYEALFLATLTACGGGGGGGGGGSDTAAAEAGTPAPSSGPLMAAPDAARFLAQATYGPTESDITSLSTTGVDAWISQQFTKPQLPHRVYLDKAASDLSAVGGRLSATQFRESYWAQAITAEDQLRQRTAFALSQIFVISTADSNLANLPRGVTTFYDMLGEKAFGNYRDLLESVSLHPMMGNYLSSIRNQKEDLASGRVPDQNYAREVMQLFSIGLYELNMDGSLKGGGTPIETYTVEDVKGLAKVFTGWSWYAGSTTAERTNRRFMGSDAHPERDWRPMQAYNQFHSVSEKKFLGTTIAATTVANTESDLKTALDQLFNHPNVGPFFGRQLIQRMVTSNPSPQYIGRVAAAFNNNGAGIRGDMKAVLRAVLTDAEARNSNTTSSTSFGKVREPILRLSHFLRAFNAGSTSGQFSGIDNTDDIANSLGQTPMQAVSVFNFYRPNYIPPNSSAAAQGLVAPELQLSNEVSVAGYRNYLNSWLVPRSDRDIQPNFSSEIALADNPGALVDRLNLLLMSGQMGADMRTRIVDAVTDRALPAATATNATDIANAKRERVSIAVLLIMASPDYLVQK
jgi:uncharacterized protein (DUF1800 family)